MHAMIQLDATCVITVLLSRTNRLADRVISRTLLRDLIHLLIRRILRRHLPQLTHIHIMVLGISLEPDVPDSRSGPRQRLALIPISTALPDRS